METFSINIKGRLLTIDRPQVMGILNATPDSFYAGSRTPEADTIARRVDQLIAEGADMIDVGGYSSRPGACDVTDDEEKRRVETAVAAIRKIDPAIPVSVDTFRASVACEAIKSMGADIINDISGGLLDEEMFNTVAKLQAPYILMHMRGTPATMQSLTEYPDGVETGVIAELSQRLHLLTAAGVADIIIDPGFGFSKTTEQNYRLMNALPDVYRMLHRPILVGISRKSMLYKPMGLTPDDVLPATIALNSIALERGAAILRVHDVAAARQAITVYQLMNNI